VPLNATAARAASSTMSKSRIARSAAAKIKQCRRERSGKQAAQHVGTDPTAWQPLERSKRAESNGVPAASQ